jgi:hypothetical protein
MGFKRCVVRWLLFHGSSMFGKLYVLEVYAVLCMSWKFMLFWGSGLTDGPYLPPSEQIWWKVMVLYSCFPILGCMETNKPKKLVVVSWHYSIVLSVHSITGLQLYSLTAVLKSQPWWELRFSWQWLLRIPYSEMLRAGWNY